MVSHRVTDAIPSFYCGNDVILFFDIQCKCYRNLHVDEITVDAETDDISITPTYEGAEQIENFNPYVDVNGNEKEINDGNQNSISR